MGRTAFALSWAFIFVVAVYDSCFAWQYRASFELWEQNPVASWAHAHFGLLALLGFKFAMLMFAALLACYCRGRRSLHEYPLTGIIGGASALLMVHYALAG